MDRYFQKLGVYYDEKIKFLSGKDKFISCNKCDSKKEFKETFEKLVFTCGSKGKCGDQIIITFPKYTHCESTLRELREELNTGLNWTSIHNFLDVSKELEDSEEKNKRINNEILSIEELFYEKNMKIKEKLLQKFYDERIRKTKKCNELLKELKKPLKDGQKKEFQKDTKRRLSEKIITYILNNEN